jgi:hypothetical protein
MRKLQLDSRMGYGRVELEIVGQELVVSNELDGEGSWFALTAEEGRVVAAWLRKAADEVEQE